MKKLVTALLVATVLTVSVSVAVNLEGSQQYEASMPNPGG